MEMDPESRLTFARDVLRKQAERIRIQQEDAKQLRKNLDEALAQRSAYEETTLCIARLWDRLLSDVDLLAARAGLPAGTEEPSPATDGSAAPPEDLDPFLHRLLRGRPLRDNVPSDSRKRKRTEPELPVSSLEEKLRQRFGSTTSKLARVLDALDKGAGAAAGATSKADADAAYARAVAAEERAARLADALIRAEEQTARMELEMAGMEEQLDRAQRQVERAKPQLDSATSGRPDLVLPPESCAPTPGPTPRPATPAGRGQAEDANKDGEREKLLSKELEAELADVRRVRDEAMGRLEKRVADLEAEKREWGRRAREEASRAAEKQADRDLQDLERAFMERIEHRLQSVAQLLHERMHGADASRQGLEAELQRAKGEQRRLEGECGRLGKELQELKAKVPLDKTRDSLMSEIERQGREMEALRGNLAATKKKLHQAEDLRSAVEEVARLRKELAAERGPLFAARGAVKEAEAKVTSLEKVMDGLRGENRRLKAFMDVVSGVVEEDMSLVEAQAESRALKSEVEELQGKLQAVEGGAKVMALEAGLKSAKERAAGLEALNEQLETARNEALSALQTAQEESAEYLREVEVVGAEYESVQQQNKDLMGRLMDMDTQIGQMRREREAMAEQIRSLEASVQDLQSQISVKDDLVRNASGNAAEARAALEAMGRELQELREPIKKEASEMVTVHGLRTERDTLKDELAGALADLEKARAEADAAKMARERAEELLGEAKAKATRLTNQLGSADAQMQDQEIKILRSMVLCSLCRFNEKDRCITKCMHVFCKKCIDKNIKSRSRKCPTCSTVFAESDVKPIFLQ